MKPGRTRSGLIRRIGTAPVSPRFVRTAFALASLPCPHAPHVRARLVTEGANRELINEYTPIGMTPEEMMRHEKHRNDM